MGYTTDLGVIAGIPIVFVEGRVGVLACPDVRRELFREAVGGPGRVILDLQDAECAEDALPSLTAVCREARNAGVGLAVVPPSRGRSRQALLRSAQADAGLTLCRSLESAAASLTSVAG